MAYKRLKPLFPLCDAEGTCVALQLCSGTGRCAGWSQCDPAQCWTNHGLVQEASWVHQEPEGDTCIDLIATCNTSLLDVIKAMSLRS